VPNNPEEPLIFSDVNKYFVSHNRRITALENITFKLEPGKVTGLVGPDAAGKTTLMRLAAGLLLPDNGSIQVLGQDMKHHALQIQSQISYMPQRFGLYEDLSVQENLDLYADLQNVSHDQRQQHYQDLMQMTGLQPFAARMAGKLSGGMKQKLGLACSLLRTPQLMILDEPTVGVDPVSRRELWEIIYQQVKTNHMTVLLSTAYLDEAERCDDVILLHEGKLLEQGPPQQFSQAVAGQTFTLEAPDKPLRELQTELNKNANIIDTLVESDRIRILCKTGQSLDQKLLRQQFGNIIVQSVQPHFEDAFVIRLKTKEVSTTRLNSLAQVHSGNLTEDMILTRNLVRRFGDFTAVNNVSFSVKRGEIFGLLGANGAGKSTTFRMLCGLLPTSEGEAIVAGHDLRTAAADARSRIGYMAQRFSLYGNLSVSQNLRFFARAYGLNKSQQNQQIEWALDTFELQNYSDSNADELSLGYKQRLSFAAALMHQPDILFLDEPTSGVDPIARREFWQRTHALASLGVTILVTTHFMEEANYCDHLVIMANGNVLAEGTPQDMKNLARNHAHPNPTMEDAFIHLIEQQAKTA